MTRCSSPIEAWRTYSCPSFRTTNPMCDTRTTRFGSFCRTTSRTEPGSMLPARFFAWSSVR